jgi:hypothetical protein
MFEKAISKQAKQVLLKLPVKYLEYNGFYLAGGTALSLQIGHRESVDLDFFTPSYPKIDLLIQEIRNFCPEVLFENQDTLDVYIDKVKVSFLSYQYPMLRGFEEYQGIKLASVEDIATMKLSAIASRGSKKDYIDLFFILKEYSLNELLFLFEDKFKGINYSLNHIKKSLIYFEDAEPEPMPKMYTNIEWERVKAEIEKKVMNLY